MLSGQLRIVFGDDQSNLESKVYNVGEYITIDSGVIHRMEGVEDAVYLEASTPEMEDVVRMSDDYQRKTVS